MAAVETLPSPPKIVVVGMDQHICYDRLATASLLISKGAEFIGTNPDPSFSQRAGASTGSGGYSSLNNGRNKRSPQRLSANQNEPCLMKPDNEWVQLLKTTVMVGDRLTTDIVGGHAADLKTIMLLSGISQREDLVDSAVQPDFIFDDIQALSEALPLL